MTARDWSDTTKLLGIPSRLFRRERWDRSSSTLTEAGPVVDTPEPSARSDGSYPDATLSAYGDHPAALGDVVLYAAGSGSAGVDATFHWEADDIGVTDRVGSDVLAVTDHQVLADGPDSGHCCAVQLQDGSILAVDPGASSSAPRLWKYSPATHAWTGPTTLSVSGYTPAVTNSWGLAVQGNAYTGEVVWLFVPRADNIDALRSSDGGSTWEVAGYAVIRSPISFATATTRVRAAIWGRQTVLTVYDSASSDIDVYGSFDPAGSFTHLGSLLQSNGGSGSQVVDVQDVAVSPGGGFVIVYRGDDTSLSSIGAIATVTTLASAGQRIADTQPQQVDPGTAPTIISMAATANSPALGLARWGSRLYLLVSANREFLSGVDQHQCEQAYYSDDGGRTWRIWAQVMIDHGANAGYLTGYDLVAVEGGLVAVSIDDNARAVRAVHLGGYSDHTLPLDRSAGVAYEDTITWSDDRIVGNRLGFLYLPAELPSVYGVSTVGTITAEAVTTGNLVSTHPTSAGYYEEDLHSSSSNAPDAIICQWRAAFLGNDRDLGVELAISDYNGTTTQALLYKCRVIANSSGFEVQYRTAGGVWTTSSTVATSLLTAKLWRMALNTSGEIEVWYCDPASVRQWTRVSKSTASGNVNGTDSDQLSTIRWGRLDAGASGGQVAQWGMVAACAWPGLYTRRGAASDVATGWSHPEDVRGIPLQYLPTQLTRGLEVSGAGVVQAGDQWTLSPRPTYPIDAISPEWTLDPRVLWRSTQTASDEFLVLDGVSAGAIAQDEESGEVVLALVGLMMNFGSVKLQQWTGAAWADISQGELNLSQGLSNMAASVSGATVRPLALGGTVVDEAPSRYLWPGELIGATVALTDGMSTWVRKVAANTGGFWGRGDHQRAALHLADADGTESGATTITIYARGGVVITRVQASALSGRLRLLIEGGQDCADSYYTAGLLALVEMLAFGEEWGGAVRIPYTAQVDPQLGDGDGIPRPTAIGRPYRAVDVSWQDAAPIYPYAVAPRMDSGHKSVVWPDSANTQAPVGTPGTTALLLSQMLMAGELDGTQPLVYMPHPPDPGVTATGPEALMVAMPAGEVTVQQAPGQAHDQSRARGSAPMRYRLRARELPGSWPDRRDE